MIHHDTRQAWVGSVSNKHNPSRKLGRCACISCRITTGIHVMTIYQINYNCFNEPFAVLPYKSLYWHMHGLIFETSIWLLAGSTRLNLHRLISVKMEIIRDTQSHHRYELHIAHQPTSSPELRHLWQECRCWSGDHIRRMQSDFSMDLCKYNFRDVEYLLLSACQQIEGTTALISWMRDMLYQALYQHHDLRAQQQLGRWAYERWRGIYATAQLQKNISLTKSKCATKAICNTFFRLSHRNQTDCF